MTPLKSNRVALGTAGVVAVYSAGYVRTREAAERFAVEDAQRRADHERRTRVPPVAPPPAITESKKDTTPPAEHRVESAAAPKHAEAKARARAQRTVAKHVD